MHMIHRIHKGSQDQGRRGAIGAGVQAGEFIGLELKIVKIAY